MIFDGLVKIGSYFKGKDYPISEYIKEMDKNKIDRAFLVPQKPLSYSMIEANDAVDRAASGNPEKFYGAVRVDPWDTDGTLKLLDEYTKKKWCRAVYLHPWAENFRINEPVTSYIFQYADRAKIPVMVEAGYPWMSHISQIGKVAEKYQKARILVTNAGQLDLSGFSLADVTYIFKKHKNLYLGTANAAAAEWLADMIDNTAEGSVIFQSNWPDNDVHMELFRIQRSYCSADGKEQVLYKNIERLIS
jgi:predicted TIM-barrel fold metal-dependent hydrolase